VHTGQVGSGATVRDPRPVRDGGDDAAAGSPGGDADGRDQVAVPALPAVRAGEVPAGGLGNPPGASGAGGGRAPLVDQAHGDPGGLGLVGQGADQVPDPPVPGPLIVPPSCLEVQDTAWITDGEGTDPVRRGPGDDRFGGFVLGLPDPPHVPGFGFPLAAPVLAPPAGAALSRLRRAAGGGPGTALAVAQVLPHSARIARPDTSGPCPSGPAAA
jgi:hypothetical protein